MDSTFHQNQNDQNLHEHDDMPKVDKTSLMTNALSIPLARPWVPSDGEGPIDNQDAWRVVEPYIEEQPIPPKHVKLSDVQIFKILTNKSITADNRYENWPFDFAKRGGIRPGRRPTSPTIFIRKGSKLYFLIFAEYYILCGTPCANIKNWLCGTWAEGKWRNKERTRWSYEHALIIDLTDPTATLSDTIHYKAPSPDVDPTEYDWDYILPTINDISLVMKPATVKYIADVAKKTVTRTTKVGNKTYTSYAYEQTPPVPLDAQPDTRPLPSGPQPGVQTAGVTNNTHSSGPSNTQPNTQPKSAVPSNALSYEHLDAMLRQIDWTPAKPSNLASMTGPSSSIPAMTAPSNPATAGTTAPSSNPAFASSSNPAISFDADFRDIKRRRLGVENKGESNPWAKIAKQIIIDGERTEHLHQEKAKGLATAINSMQDMVDTMKENLQQMSFNTPFSVAVQTVQRMIRDNSHDKMGVQDVTKDMREALDRMRSLGG
ncbi:hypothetical protein IFM46972_02959 [Aspergillus udagawae]|uniref:Uncharacterized protein n=1 Tax=Aspergillus udagawae TaxID=91492 RepID=A0A8H3NFA3_9EURO|nr:hypothetical protein IFM46972_02959 [Aspergillus udagawae]